MNRRKGYSLNCVVLSKLILEISNLPSLLKFKVMSILLVKYEFYILERRGSSVLLECHKTPSEGHKTGEI